jgi:hypothetical protein
MTNSLGVFLVPCLIEYVTKSTLCSIFVPLQLMSALIRAFFAKQFSVDFLRLFQIALVRSTIRSF